MNCKIFTILLLLLVSIAARSQENTHSTLTWEDFVSIMADETDEEYGPDTELFENLHDIHCNPMNLNTITQDELHQLPFLSEDDIKNIMFYIDNHRPLYSTGELMFIISLDRQKRMMLQLFCYAGEVKGNDYSIKNIFRYSHHEAIIRTDIPFYTKAGYENIDDSILIKNPNKKYLGNQLYQSFRYNFSSQNHFFAGFQMEKDAGEKYIDHISGYAMIKDIGIFHTAILGNYRVSFGHGLVINTSSLFGKAMKLSSMEIIDKGITRHSSTSENGYFRGAAASLKFGNTLISSYISYKDADGTFNSDSSGILSIKQDGLHRTPLERSKKGNIAITDFGGNIHFDLKELQLSATCAVTHINAPLSPKYDTPNTIYKMYSPQGYDFSAYSISYSYRITHLLFTGETAINSKKGFATLNQLQWCPNSLNTITLIQRQYGAKYYALNARAFGDNTNAQNERGIYLGVNSSAISKLNLNGYIDAIYFPWLKYQTGNSSYAFEILGQLTYEISNNQKLNFRYRYKSKQKDSKNDDCLVWKNNHNFRFQYNLNIKDNIICRTTLTGVINNIENSTSKGYSIGQSFRYTSPEKFRLDASIIYFNTDSYDSRIYNYESSPQYSFSMNSYYYKGIRATLLSTWHMTKQISLTGKISSTIYLDRSTIGSNLDLINSNNKEDLLLQLKIRL